MYWILAANQYFHALTQKADSILPITPFKIKLYIYIYKRVEILQYSCLGLQKSISDEQFSEMSIDLNETSNCRTVL